MAHTSTVVLMLSLFGVSFVRGALKSPIVGIINGHTVDIEDNRYMAALLQDRSSSMQLRCGGSIIHPQFILTAAQCLTEKIDDLIIQVGSTTLSTGETRQLFEVDKVFIHDQYNGTNFAYDIGLIKLDSYLTFGPTVGDILLADETVLTPTNFIGNVTGWGITKKDVTSPSEELRQVAMNVRRPVDCERNFETFSADKEICLWKVHTGPCIGDAGGPFTADDLQIGIISRGNTCGHMPTVVVKVAPHLEWIDSIISENN